ncbi:MAG: Flp pilus assembly complex ATPase component TadA [Alphaproteobacteria bacterium]|nr:Flp pilus assembly complex ATPase component TadA [Alphaproteobacteria bacterium]
MDFWPDEPPRIRVELVDDLILWCVMQRASDITIQSDRPTYIEVDGKLFPVTRRSIDSADIAAFVTKMYGLDAMAALTAGKDLDLSYEIRVDRNTRFRFRVNITAILSKGRDGVSITMRVLPNVPPRMSDLGIEKELIDAWAPRQGLVFVTGPTGSGKTTLLAAGTRMLIERTEGAGKMLTYEAPIEYVYDQIVGPHSIIAQSEIPRNLPSFAAGVRNALRRKPNIILVGEARDRETVSAAIEAGQTGHLVYATTHTIGVAATVRRLVSVFDSGERLERAYALIESTRLIVTQALVPRVGGGRVALREYLIFDEHIREHLLETPLENWTSETQNMLEKYGRTMQKSANEIYSQGLIDRRHYLLLSRGFGDEGIDDPKP